MIGISFAALLALAGGAEGSAVDLSICATALHATPILSEPMREYWSSLDEETQEDLVLTIERFWRHAFHNSKLPLALNIQVFAGMMENFLFGPLGRWPKAWDRIWLAEFFDELITHVSTAPYLKPRLRLIRATIP